MRRPFPHPLRRPRPRTVAIGAFVLLLVAAPFVPNGGDDDRSLLPSGDEDVALAPATAAGQGRLTPALRAEIDRVVAEGRTLGRLSARQAPDRLAADLVRCAEFEGQRYCLDQGWTTATESQVQARTATAARTVAARRTTTESTGDLDVLGSLRRAASLSPTERAAADRAELTQAARSVAKVWLLRHQIEGVALPTGFLARHPEAQAAPSSARTTTRSGTVASDRTAEKRFRDYPASAVVMDPRRVSEQERTYWCGPTTMQMITWGWRGVYRSQAYWAGRLGTTTGGSAISDMVRVVNDSTGWDRPSHAGTYVALDIGSYTVGQWTKLVMRHVVDYRAPLVLHPVLQKRFYPYLDDDASGHFQVGRGYNTNGDRPTQIGYFEPWNQQRFDPSEPYISRVQWRQAYRSYRANQAHFQHNIGV
jgi:hypothetical protein